MAKVLTVPFVGNAKPKNVGGEKVRREVPDARQPGLYLIVQPSGKKSWAVRYRFGGVPKKLTLGSSPGINLTDARKLASKALTTVAEGRDPSVARAEQKNEQARAAAEEKRGQRDLFENVAIEFIERYSKPRAKSKNRPDAWRETARILGLRADPENPSQLIVQGGDVIPAWKGRKVQQISKRDVIALLDGVVDRGSPIMANRVLAATRKLFNWCMARDIVPASPCAAIQPPASERSRDRVLSDDEIRGVWNAADVDGWPFGSLVKVLMLTGQRLNEVAGMCWDELDLEGKLWLLPAERVKNATKHEVPLSDAAIAVISKAPRIKGRLGLVFTTTGDSPVSGFSRAKERLDAAIATDAAIEPWRLHDLRRTMASGMARLGIQLPVIEKILNHSSGSFRGVAGVYQRHSYSEEKRKALDAWASFVQLTVSGEQPGNVVAMRAG